MKILVAPDKFKGSLSAGQAAAAITAGLRKAWPEAEIRTIPIADGGEGTAGALCLALNGEWRATETVNPFGEPMVAPYVWLPSAQQAVIEMSAASGLQLIPPGKRDPLRASTRGTGIMMRAAITAGAKSILLAVGGSGTNDGGAGMANALGYEFLTSDGEPLDPVPANLLALIAIKDRQVVDPIPPVIAACDVRNPLLGARGASRTFGPQKGATPLVVEQLEEALANLADVVAADLECDHRETPGSGAAGGMGFGLLSFCNATIRSGFGIVAEMLRLNELVHQYDLVVTGEGSLDSQTLEGKAPAGLAGLAKSAGCNVLGIGGKVTKEGASLFDGAVAISALAHSPEDSMERAAELLERTSEEAGHTLRTTGALPSFSS